MKVLFVSSGNSKTGIGIIVKNQGESIANAGVELDYFAIEGKGVKGYLSNLPKLKQVLRTEKYDVIHAHYSLSGFLATLAGAKPLVVSLMGSDVQASNRFSKLIQLSARFFWDATIVKSEVMNNKLKLKKAYVVPNGVNLKLFNIAENHNYRSELNFENNKKYVAFVANPERYEKNYKLAQEAIEVLNDSSVVLLPIYNRSHEMIVKYMQASDALIFTSLWEGSPNVIKEAMACNCPIVSVDVGDVKEVIESVENCYLASYDAKDIAEKLKIVLANGQRTNGREKILKMGLDSESVAKRIVGIYNQVLEG